MWNFKVAKSCIFRTKREEKPKGARVRLYHRLNFLLLLKIKVIGDLSADHPAKQNLKCKREIYLINSANFWKRVSAAAALICETTIWDHFVKVWSSTLVVSPHLPKPSLAETVKVVAHLLFNFLKSVLSLPFCFYSDPSKVTKNHQISLPAFELVCKYWWIWSDLNLTFSRRKFRHS